MIWRRPSFVEAYAKVLADIEREYPIEQMRAENKMRELQREIARKERRHRLENGGEYQHGLDGFQGA